MVQPRASQLLNMLVDITTAAVLKYILCVFFFHYNLFHMYIFTFFLNLVYHCKLAKYKLPV